MTVAAGSLCFACKRWNGGTCEAFPEGIPASIMFDGFDHRQPHEGDNGKRFVLGDADQLAVYEQMKATIATFEPPEVFPEQVKALAVESGFAEEVARVEFKHGDKGEPGYQLLHPGKGRYRILDITDTRQFEQDEDERWRAIPGTGDPRPCDRCGKEHEIHVSVEKESGERCVVGLGCARVGGGDDDTLKAGSSSATTLARLRAEAAHLRAQVAAWNEARAQVNALGAPSHVVTTEGNHDVWTTEDGRSFVWVRATDDLTERLEALHDDWRKSLLKERGFDAWNKAQARLEDVEKRLARAEKKLRKLTASAPEYKHGDKGEPGYELLHPGRTKLVPTEGAEAVFKRPVKGTRFERPSYDEWIPDLVDTDHASYVKGKVGVALRERIRSSSDYKEAMDAIPEVDLMRKGQLGGSLPRKRMDFYPEEDYKEFLRGRWAANVGLDSEERRRKMVEAQRTELVRLQELWKERLPPLQAQAPPEWPVPTLLERFLQADLATTTDVEGRVYEADHAGRRFRSWLDIQKGEERISDEEYSRIERDFDTAPLRNIGVWLPEAEPFEALPEGSVEDMEREVKLAVLVRHFIDQWASSSGDSAPDSIAVQRRLSEWTKVRFGQPAGDTTSLRKYAETSVYGADPYKPSSRQNPWEISDESLGLFGSFLDLFFDAMYDETQQAFREAGIKVVQLHRGMGFESDKAPQWIKDDYLDKKLPLGKSKSVELTMNPASSWATSGSVASEFARGAVMVNITQAFPIERILATAASGIGALPEAEMVVLGYPFVTDVAWRITKSTEDRWGEADNAKTTS